MCLTCPSGISKQYLTIEFKTQLRAFPNLMHELLLKNMEHIIAFAIFLGRIGDMTTTYLGSPKLKLESNPMVRKFRWPLVLATFLLCLTPYIDVRIGIMFMVLFFMVTMSNSLRIWLIRAIGEDEYYLMLVRAAGQADLRSSLILNMVPGVVMLFLSLSLMVLYHNPDQDLGFWFACGILSYSIILFIYFPKNFMRLRRTALNNQPA